MVAVKLGAPAPLQRRHTIPQDATGKNRVSICPQRSSFSIADRRAGFSTELVELKLIPLSYTSLKDILQTSPAGIPSPTTVDCCPSNGEGIAIRNRLVKQAAWAYLQPMAASPSIADRNIFRRIWPAVSAVSSRDPVSSCLGFLKECLLPTLSWALPRLLGILRLGTSR